MASNESAGTCARDSFVHLQNMCSVTVQKQQKNNGRMEPAEFIHAREH